MSLRNCTAIRMEQQQAHGILCMQTTSPPESYRFHPCDSLTLQRIATTYNEGRTALRGREVGMNILTGVFGSRSHRRRDRVRVQNLSSRSVKDGETKTSPSYSVRGAGTAPNELSPVAPASSALIVPFSIGQSLHNVSKSSKDRK